MHDNNITSRSLVLVLSKDSLPEEKKKLSGAHHHRTRCRVVECSILQHIQQAKEGSAQGLSSQPIVPMVRISNLVMACSLPGSPKPRRTKPPPRRLESDDEELPNKRINTFLLSVDSSTQNISSRGRTDPG